MTFVSRHACTIKKVVSGIIPNIPGHFCSTYSIIMSSHFSLTGSLPYIVCVLRGFTRDGVVLLVLESLRFGSLKDVGFVRQNLVTGKVVEVHGSCPSLRIDRVFLDEMALAFLP